MEQIILESHPAFIILCVGLAVGYAFLLYTSKHPWTKTMNWILFSIRTVLAFFLTFLLLSPIVKQVNNIFEKPVFVILQDNSISVNETTDSLFRQNLENVSNNLLKSLSDKGHETSLKNLDGNTISKVAFNGTTSDLHSALRKIVTEYEGRSVAGVMLVSDGIYNSGLSPLFANYNFPVHTVGVGDTAQRQDIILKDLVYNKIAYQGNKFPLRAEIMIKGFPNENVSITLSQSGKILEKQTRNSGANQMLVVDFTIIAAEQGIQRYDVQVEVKKGESNTRNNRSTAFVEVVEGKKKILLIASAPHPDIKALRSVIEKNLNYDFLLHIQGVNEVEPKYLLPQNIDLAIFHQAPDKRGRTRDFFQKFVNSKTSLFIIVGQQTDIPVLTQSGAPLKFEQPPRQVDDVMPVVNTAFSNFILSPEANTVFSGFPPVWVPFAKIQIPASANPLLFQKVGSLATDKPLLWIDVPENRKTAIMLADGFWQWRLEEYSKNENTEAFDEVFGKLIQYLSTTDDKSKFRSYPVEQQFSETEPVLFESQVYNDIYEPVYGNKIDLELTDDAGKKYNFNYVTSPGNARYQIGGLKEGIYRYKSSTEINGKKEEVRGQFLIAIQETELQNLTADFNLLRKLSASTGGNFYKASELDKALTDLSANEARATIHSEEKYDALLNLKWIFFLLLVLVSTEWFLRKYFGSY